MNSWIERGVGDFLADSPDVLVQTLAARQMQYSLPGRSQHLHAWDRSIGHLRHALAAPECRGWTLHLEYPLMRVGKRADAVLLTERAIFVLEFKTGAATDLGAAARQVEDYALDLWDFHAGSRQHPVIPLVVAANLPTASAAPVLPLAAVWPVQHATGAGLGDALRHLNATVPLGLPLDAGWWRAQPYRPVPSIVEAARMAFQRQAVPEINATRAGTTGLRATTDAILRHIAEAHRLGEYRVVFVTGIPGAGKTRCGLAVAFEGNAEGRAVFLTGNPSLIHVFREALARDAARQGASLRRARQEMEGKIQPLPWFRDHHLNGATPDERIIIVDEAQRSWSREHAVRKTADRKPPLTDSEPGHILDAMGRHDGWAVVVCLVGGGQEIHDGEGGLAEWGAALAARPLWRAFASAAAIEAPDPRQRISRSVLSGEDAALHLAVAVRNLQTAHAAAWADAVLRGDQAEAWRIAAVGSLPYFITRDLGALRHALRGRARGQRRAGLVASAGAKRLRAEGLGAELPHMDAKAVANWFLDSFPADIRGSDALDVVATQFSCQGLELDFVGLAWGGDLVRQRDSWQVRYLHGTDWRMRQPDDEAWSNQINTYRVLLTRARYETVIWVPGGSPAGGFHDRTRPAAEMDAIADFLLACGARPLAATEPAPAEPALSLV